MRYDVNPLGAVVLLGTGKVVEHELHEPGGTPSGSGGQVPAVHTPANASQVAQAIVAALRAMGRPVTRQESWLYPLAVSCLETDTPPRQWRQLYNNNLGNVTGGSSWYTNPHVGSSLRFRSFSSLVAGARGMLEAINHHGGLAAADAGDLAGFQAAMTKYLGNKNANGDPVPYPDLSGVIASLRGTIVDVA